LGAGKSTFLTYLTSKLPNKRIAVVQNEFGPGIEKEAGLLFYLNK